MNPELLFGKIAVDAGFVRREHVQECLAEQKRLRQEGRPEKLGELLVRRGHLTDEKRRWILTHHEFVETRAVDRRFGVLAVKNGFCSKEQLKICLDQQRREYVQSKTLPRIGALLLREGHLTEEQVEAIARLQERLGEAARRAAAAAPPPIPSPARRPSPRVPEGPLAAGARSDRGDAAGCSLCTRELEEEDELVLCGGCGAAHHRVCYELRAACGVCRRPSGEAARSAEPARPLPPPPRSSRRPSSALRAAVPAPVPNPGAYSSAEDPDGDGPMMRDLSMEGHLAAIGLWYRIVGMLGLVGIVLVLLAVAASEPLQLRARTYAVTVFAICVVVLLGLLGSTLVMVLGHHLARRSNAARLTAGLLTVLGLLGEGLALAGTAASILRPEMQEDAAAAGSVGLALLVGILSLLWGLALLWALFNSRASWICSESYHRAVLRGPREAPYTFRSPFFWIPMIPALLGAGGILLSLLAPA